MGNTRKTMVQTRKLLAQMTPSIQEEEAQIERGGIANKSSKTKNGQEENL